MSLRIDISNWEPLTVTEVNHLFAESPIPWGIAGGWALDMYLGRKTREHSDIDIVIFREHQQVVYQLLNGDWDLYKAKNGELSLWQEGEYLDAVNDIWVRRDAQSPWAFQIMLMESEQEQWIYRREKSIKLPKAEIFSADGSGVPYLKPEIQLLYKAGSSQIREKDSRDFQAVLPSLSSKEKAWLEKALKRQFPSGQSRI